MKSMSSVEDARIREIWNHVHEKKGTPDLGPLHMSPVDRAGSVTGMNFALGSYEKFQPGFRDEKRSKILGTSSGAKFRKQSKPSETQKF